MYEIELARTTAAFFFHHSLTNNCLSVKYIQNVI